MVKFSKKIALSDNEKIVGEIELNCSIVQNTAVISYSDSFSDQGSKSGPNFFYVLADIREEYQNKGFLLLCKGAQESVFPGGLASDSSFGELAYEFTDSMKEPVTVNIFDTIDISSIHSIVDLEVQKANRRKTLRNRQGSR